VERHAVILPDEFVASASDHRWKVPAKDCVPARAEAQVDPSFWLDWGNRLSTRPEAQAPPDPAVFGHYRLDIRFHSTEGKEEEIEAFEENVWDKLAVENGETLPSHAGDFGYRLFLERILLKQQESVLRLTLDGLRRYGLMDCATVTHSAPDPDNWHRDRKVIVWSPDGGE
jgi:hypothetical protein